MLHSETEKQSWAKCCPLAEYEILHWGGGMCSSSLGVTAGAFLARGCHEWRTGRDSRLVFDINPAWVPYKRFISIWNMGQAPMIITSKYCLMTVFTYVTLSLSDSADWFHVFMGSILSSKHLQGSSKQGRFANGPELSLVPGTGM